MTTLAAGDTLVLGTRNPGKISELTSLLEPYGIHVKTIDDVLTSPLDEPEENGITFLDNALIKAKAYAKETGFPVLTDDSGLCIDAMDHKPGVHTKPYFDDLGGYERGFQSLARILYETSHPPYKASMHCVLVVAWPDGSYQDFSGICEGEVVFPPRCGGKNSGFGVDPIFQPDGSQKTFAEDIVYKSKVSHRTRALKAFTDAIYQETTSD